VTIKALNVDSTVHILTQCAYKLQSKLCIHDKTVILSHIWSHYWTIRYQCNEKHTM